MYQNHLKFTAQLGYHWSEASNSGVRNLCPVTCEFVFHMMVNTQMVGRLHMGKGGCSLKKPIAWTSLGHLGVSLSTPFYPLRSPHHIILLMPTGLSWKDDEVMLSYHGQDVNKSAHYRSDGPFLEWWTQSECNASSNKRRQYNGEHIDEVGIHLGL